MPKLLSREKYGKSGSILQPIKARYDTSNFIFGKTQPLTMLARTIILENVSY